MIHKFDLNLLGPAGENLARALTRTPPTRFPESGLTAGRGRRRGVSIGSRLASSGSPGKPGWPHRATLLGFSHRHAPEHLSRPPSGLLVHLASRRTLLPTADAPWMALPRSTRAARETPGVPSIDAQARRSDRTGSCFI
jgi:hypothetical protein